MRTRHPRMLGIPLWFQESLRESSPKIYNNLLTDNAVRGIFYDLVKEKPSAHAAFNRRYALYELAVKSSLRGAHAAKVRAHNNLSIRKKAAAERKRSLTQRVVETIVKKQKGKWVGDKKLAAEYAKKWNALEARLAPRQSRAKREPYQPSYLRDVIFRKMRADGKIPKR